MYFAKQTKIVATLGPASDTETSITQLIQAGVNVFRFNMKHNSVSWHRERIELVDRVAKQLHQSIGILIDLQGPEIRLETLNHQDVPIAAGETLRFSAGFTHPDNLVVIPHPEIFSAVAVGESVLIDDGFLEFTVTEIGSDYFLATAKDDYLVKHRKGVNLPGRDILLPSLIEADLDKLDMAVQAKVDFIALSFCRRAADIQILREQMSRRHLTAAVVAKIESPLAITNLDEILEVVDAVMVARGDLGVEAPIEQLAYQQKRIISACRAAKKPVIVATQMLQSMISSPLPTRAEATDVSNAVWDGTDAVMLSGETASGKYPLKAVEAMAKIITFNQTCALVPPVQLISGGSTEAIVEAAANLLTGPHSVHPSKILVFTETGYTARVVSALRPQIPIIAVTNSAIVAEQLSLSYGVTTQVADFPVGEFQFTPALLDALKRQNYVASGEIILLIHGQHWHRPGATNSLALQQV